MSASSNSCKRLKVSSDTDKNDEDIISNLPESIISRILSLLSSKDVVRTCVLSKDWEYKWTRVYNIDIDDRVRLTEKRTRKKSVVDFVDRILLVSQHSNLKSFRLSCFHVYGPGRIMTWLSAVLLRQVENVEIDYRHEGGVLPRCLFHCKSLTKLKLRMRCTLRIPVQYWFSNLEMLHLHEVKIVNGLVSKTSQLILNFRVLRTLELDICVWRRMNFVEIKAPALTTFSVTHNVFFSQLENCRIKISGAKLLKFHFYSHFAEYFDLSASSVSFAAILFPTGFHGLPAIEWRGLPFRLLLKGFSGLNRLEITGDIVEAITQSNQGPPLPIFSELKRLELYRKCSGGALLELLHAMPFLESVVFDMSAWNDYDYGEMEFVPSCIVSHLHEVQFLRFKGKRPHVNMANFLLKHAVGLKNMLGLSRCRSKERQIEKNFWTELKSIFKDGEFGVASSVKTIADFERLFG